MELTYKIGDGYLELTDLFYPPHMTRLGGWNPAEYGITDEQTAAYLDSLCAHITYVREAGRKLGVPDYQLRYHDQSKFSFEELPYYVRNFHGDKQDPDGFAMAWLHHLHANEHHWQHYIFSDGFTPKGSMVEDGCLPMPSRYVLEMVSDWMGASYVYTGSWDMSDWLLKNLPRIKIHSRTAELLESILGTGMPDYGLVFEELRVKGEWGK